MPPNTSTLLAKMSRITLVFSNFVYTLDTTDECLEDIQQTRIGRMHALREAYRLREVIASAFADICRDLTDLIASYTSEPLWPRDDLIAKVGMVR